MWSSSRAMRTGAAIVALALLPVLAACSGFTPVYGTPSSLAAGQVPIAYAQPGNRLEQIIYEDLALHLGHGAGGPTLSVSTTQRIDSLTSDTVASAQSQKQLILSAIVTLKGSDGAVLFRGQRIATADYTDGPQILANKQAQQDAGERAAHSLADSIRLTVLGALSK